MARVGEIRDCVNFRELGGYRASDGRVVKHGLIYRSGGLYRLDAEELAWARGLGLATIVDLRSTGEIELKPDPPFEGTQVVRHSGLEFRGGEEIDFSPEGMRRIGDGARDQYAKFTYYYREMPFDNEAFRNLMAALEAGQAPLLYHCASGKDRTGVASMVVLLALGVDEKTILSDYLLSNELLADDIETALAEHADHVAADPIQAKLIHMESGVLEETGLSVLAEIHRRYPSVEAYLEAEFGLDDGRLAALRDRYLSADEEEDAALPGEAALAAALAGDAERRARILFTSDVHGAVSWRSYADGAEVGGGFCRLSTLIAELRDENTIVIDGGDTLEGSPLSSYHARHGAEDPFPATCAMAHIGYDYLVLGNHDFNYGRPAIERHLARCGAQDITGNVSAEGEPAAAPFQVHEAAGMRVALIGATTCAIPRWELPANIEGLAFGDAVEHVRAAVSRVRAEELADIVVVAYHGGFERDPETGEPIGDDTDENQAWRMLAEVEGIDVLLTGHQHRVMCGVAAGPDGRRVAYVQPGQRGEWLACVDIDRATGAAEPLLIDVSCEPDEDLTGLLADEEAACQLWLDQPLGSSNVDLSVADALEAEVEKSQLVTFLNLVQLEASGAELSATAIFPGATGFPREITMRDLVSTYRFANTLAVKRVTGEQLRAYLERCAEYFALDGNGRVVRAPAAADPPQDFNYDMVDGIDYTIDLRNPAGSRIVSLSRDGRDIAPEESFTLAVNSYRAAGGGGFPMIAEAETVREIQTDMVELIANYITAHSPIDFEPRTNICVITGKERA